MRPLSHACLNTVLEGLGRVVRVERLVSFDVIGVGVAVEFDRPGPCAVHAELRVVPR